MSADSQREISRHCSVIKLFTQEAISSHHPDIEDKTYLNARKLIIEPVHDILVLISYMSSRSLCMHAQLSSGARGLIFSMNLHPCLF